MEDGAAGAKGLRVSRRREKQQREVDGCECGVEGVGWIGGLRENEEGEGGADALNLFRR